MLVQIPKPKPPKLIWMNTVTMKETTFLWYPYIPVGVATLIYGPGGMGKSHIAVDITARVTTGRGMPGFENDKRPAEKVLIMSAEDELERVLGPRLVKAGADLSKVASPDRVFTLDKRGLEYVDDFISQASVGIVFIDPIVSYIGSKVDINKANETRDFTGGLNGIAQAHNVPIVIIGHSRKSTEGSDADRAMGSVDFVNASRSALFVTTGPDGSNIMKHSKHNYSPKGYTMGFEFGDKGFEWTGVYTDDSTLAPTKASKRQGVVEWLKKRLASGPVASVQLMKEAEDLGFNERTVKRAKKGVAISDLVSEGGKLKWYFKLKEQSDASETDVPVMGDKWGVENQGRRGSTEREIIARENGRVLEPIQPVGSRGSTGKRADKSNGLSGTVRELPVEETVDDIESLMDRVLK